jgi:hypothetical protein
MPMLLSKKLIPQKQNESVEDITSADSLVYFPSVLNSQGIQLRQQLHRAHRDLATGNQPAGTGICLRVSLTKYYDPQTAPPALTLERTFIRLLLIRKMGYAGSNL